MGSLTIPRQPAPALPSLGTDVTGSSEASTDHPRHIPQPAAPAAPVGASGSALGSFSGYSKSAQPEELPSVTHGNTKSKSPTDSTPEIMLNMIIAAGLLAVAACCLAQLLRRQPAASPHGQPQTPFVADEETAGDHLLTRPGIGEAEASEAQTALGGESHLRIGANLTNLTNLTFFELEDLNAENDALELSDADQRAEALRQVEHILSARSVSAILGSGSLHERRSEFRRLARLLHPDKNLVRGERADLALRRLVEAHKTMNAAE